VYAPLKDKGLASHGRLDPSRRSLLRLGLAGAVALTAPSASALFRPSGKKGFCGPESLYRDNLGCEWYYNWSLAPYLSLNIPFAPMVWGWRPEQTPVQLRHLPAREQILFGFNELDGRRQANMSVPEALDAWHILQTLADEIVSPSCVNSLGRWMSNFMLQSDHRKLKIDAIGVHSYSGPNSDQVIGRLEETWRLYGRPIWVTEIAVADWRAVKNGERNRYSVNDTLRFMDEIVTFLEETPWVRGYCWLANGNFGDGGPLSTSAFFDAERHPSPIFHKYAGQRTKSPAAYCEARTVPSWMSIWKSVPATPST
jgi:hypothetical protein